jgi:hypothetical protein
MRNLFLNFFDILKFVFYVFSIIGSYRPGSQNTSSKTSLLVVGNRTDGYGSSVFKEIRYANMMTDQSFEKILTEEFGGWRIRFGLG